jgi:3-hydroxyisobutyrate dehydrogenase-like beta-hydroxyacid dehydrogenase
MSPKVGFIGLGTMGGPMARRLTSAGLSVTGFDRNPAALDACPQVHRADTALACAQSVDLLLTSLPRDNHKQLVGLPREHNQFCTGHISGHCPGGLRAADIFV